EDWDVKITFSGMISRLFLRGLSQKVRRGMRGAAQRGTCLGKLSLGFARVVCRDDQGSIVLRPDGRPRHRIAVDETTRPYRELLYELFVSKLWSTYQITKHFNELKVEDWDGWTESAIKSLLRSPTAIGVFVWNRTRKEYDWEQEKWIVVENPRKD